jgi:bacterioferritin
MTQAALTDVKTLRERARKHIEDGAVTDSYRGDRKEVIRLLNEALATELVCVLRYKLHFFTAIGLSAKSVAAEFAEHAAEESAHADLLAARIVQLGGEPDFNPDTLTKRSHAEYQVSSTLSDMIREDLIAERIAIESYGEMVTYIGTQDPTSRRVLEQILAQEEEHAEDLSSLLKHLVHQSEPAKQAKSQSGRMNA